MHNIGLEWARGWLPGFCNQLKALYWDGQGFVMIYKRLRVTPLIQPSCQPQQRFRGNLEKYVLLSHDTDQG